MIKNISHLLRSSTTAVCTRHGEEFFGRRESSQEFERHLEKLRRFEGLSAEPETREHQPHGHAQQRGHYQLSGRITHQSITFLIDISKTCDAKKGPHVENHFIKNNNSFMTFKNVNKVYFLITCAFQNSYSKKKLFWKKIVSVFQSKVGH